jgi:hypothetical protein
MKTFPARGVWLTLSLCLITTSVWAQDFGSPSLLYPQQGNTYPITPVNYGGQNGQPDTLPSPSDVPPMNAPMYGGMNQPTPAPQPNSGMEYGNGYDGGYGNGTYPAPNTPYQPGAAFNQAMSANWGDGSASCGGSSCGDYGCGTGGCNGGWFGYAGGLIMTRANTCGRALSYNAAGYQVLNTNQVEQPWMGGVEVAFGKWFCCCRVGMEVVYWSLFPSQQSFDYSGAPGMYSALDFTGVTYNGTPVNNYWHNAQRQYLRRDNSFYNIEVNLIGNAWNFGGCCGGGGYIAGYGGGGCCDDACYQNCSNYGGSCLTVGWLAGVRYFDFIDNLYYASSTNDTVLNGTVDEMFYANNVHNQLLGFQMGGYMSYQFACRWSVYGGAKGGIFNNHASLYQRLYGVNGNDMISSGPYAGHAAMANSSANSLAALGQLDVGLRWQATCHLAFRAGYRIVGISGVALSDDQYLYNYRDYSMYKDINTCGSLILHGAYAGGEFCW